VLPRGGKLEVLSDEPGKIRLLYRETKSGSTGLGTGGSGAAGRIAELRQLIAEQEAALKRAPGGGARARIKRKLEPLREELKNLEGKTVEPPRVEPPPPAVKPVPKVEPPKPTPTKFGDFRDDLPDISDVPTNEEIRKAHFGWTSKVAEKERQRLIGEKLPSLEDLRKAHPGWTNKVAQKRLDEIRTHFGLSTEKPPVAPVRVTPPAKKAAVPPVKPLEFKPDPTLEGIKEENVLSQLKGAENSLRLVGIDLGAGRITSDEAARKLASINIRIQQLQFEIERRAKSAESGKFLAGRIEDRIVQVREKYESSLVDQKVDLNSKVYGFGRGAALTPEGMDVKFAIKWADNNPDIAEQLKLFARQPDGSFHLATQWTGRDLAVFADTMGGYTGYMRWTDLEKMRKFSDFAHPYILAARGQKAGVTKESIEAFLKGGVKKWDDKTVDRVFGISAVRQRAVDRVGTAVDKAVNWYQTHMDGDVAKSWEDNARQRNGAAKVALNTKGRAFFQYNGDWDKSFVSLEKGGRMQTAVHEYGHFFEYNTGQRFDGRSYTSSVQRDAAAFRNYRGAKSGKEATEIYRGSREYGFKDEFMTHYMGKVYTGRDSTEIVSMGFEMLASDPVRLYQQDPEYFWFMVGLLKGDLVAT
jgi:hypothetical protein